MPLKQNHVAFISEGSSNISAGYVFVMLFFYYIVRQVKIDNNS